MSNLLLNVEFPEVSGLRLDSGVEAYVCDDPCLIAIRECRPDAQGDMHELYLDAVEAQALQDWLTSLCKLIPKKAT